MKDFWETYADVLRQRNAQFQFLSDHGSALEIELISARMDLENWEEKLFLDTQLLPDERLWLLRTVYYHRNDMIRAQGVLEQLVTSENAILRTVAVAELSAVRDGAAVATLEPLRGPMEELDSILLNQFEAFAEEGLVRHWVLQLQATIGVLLFLSQSGRIVKKDLLDRLKNARDSELSCVDALEIMIALLSRQSGHPDV